MPLFTAAHYGSGNASAEFCVRAGPFRCGALMALKCVEGDGVLADVSKLVVVALGAGRALPTVFSVARSSMVMYT